MMPLTLLPFILIGQVFVLTAIQALQQKCWLAGGIFMCAGVGICILVGLKGVQ